MLTKLTAYTKLIKDLADQPSLSPDELRAYFDSSPEEIRVAFNRLIDDLQSATGASEIGATLNEFSGDTVQSILSYLKQELNNVVLDQVPDGSITERKLAENAVDFGPVQKEIANLNLQLEASQRVQNGTTFGDDFLGNRFGFTLDTTKTNVTGALLAGETVVAVESVTGLQVGHEVTIYDDVNIERVTISAIAGNDLTVSALVNSYKDQANIARTMAEVDNGKLKFGGWSTQETNTVTDATVTPNAYDTSGNGGRKTAHLSNGWIVAVAKTTDYFYFYVDKQDGNGFVDLCYMNNTTIDSGDISIVAKGTKVYTICVTGSGVTIVSHYFDATTVTNTNIYSTNNVVVDTSQTAIGNVSLTINEAGTELHASWSSKNATYPNSFNIRYAKGTINADGSVTWGSVEQWTKFNTSGTDIKDPSISIREDGKPIVLSIRTNGYFVLALGEGLQNPANSVYGVSVSIVDDAGSYTQSSPSAIFVPQSVNGLANGRIWNVWHGKDSTDTSYNNIRVSYSDDGGVTWSAMQKLTSGNAFDKAFPSITANKNGEIFILCNYSTSIYQIRYSNGSWQTPNLGTSAADSPSSLFDPTFSLDFSEPLFIYKDTAKVGFYGTWTVGSTVPLLENDVRYTIDKPTDEIVAWVERDADLTVNAEVNGEVPTKVTEGNEDQFTHTLASVTDIELKLAMTRGATTDDVGITKILGGVG